MPSPPLEQQLPPEPPRRRRGARMYVRGGLHFSTPQHSSNNNYPPLYEDPQIGGPSNAVSEVDSALVEPAPQIGYDNPIPSYPGAAGYNPYEQQAYSGYNYNNVLAVDLYIEATNYNALYPGPFPATYPTGYPAYGYQYPPPPQPQQQQPQPPQIQPPQ
ncbi:uncharacterized protein LOC110893331 [Helianthus annuus]|uniref:uncharacterized protein LOC110893331 n=1 Tax=Helianthus annuus TaxID=4232 RepID=UPI000B8F72D2|nr:uncharacterized protein LOC110893331 [Helianthus annuus]